MNFFLWLCLRQPKTYKPPLVMMSHVKEFQTQWCQNFWNRTQETSRIFRAFEQLSGSIGWQVMAAQSPRHCGPKRTCPLASGTRMLAGYVILLQPGRIQLVKSGGGEIDKYQYVAVNSTTRYWELMLKRASHIAMYGTLSSLTNRSLKAQQMELLWDWSNSLQNMVHFWAKHVAK